MRFKLGVRLRRLAPLAGEFGELNRDESREPAKLPRGEVADDKLPRGGVVNAKLPRGGVVNAKLPRGELGGAKLRELVVEPTLKLDLRMSLRLFEIGEASGLALGERPSIVASL